MKKRIGVRELMQREGLSGEVVELFYSRSTGIIHGDDGYDVTFNEESLVVGLAYSELGIGLRVSYGIFFAAGAKVATAINVRPASDSRTETTENAENAVSARGDGFGVVQLREWSRGLGRFLGFWLSARSAVRRPRSHSP